MGYIVFGLAFLIFFSILYRNILTDINKNKNIKKIFSIFDFSVRSDFGLQQEKVLHINLLDLSQDKIGSLQVFGYKTVDAGDKSAFIQFKYVDRDGNEHLAMNNGPRNKAQYVENGKTISYRVTYLNDNMSCSVKVRDHLFEIFKMKIEGVKYYEILNRNFKKVEIF